MLFRLAQEVSCHIYIVVTEAVVSLRLPIATVQYPLLGKWWRRVADNSRRLSINQGIPGRGNCGHYFSRVLGGHARQE